MTNEQKQQIIKLRQDGYGYATIASSLGLTKNQVSAFCRRSNLTGTKAAVHIEEKPEPNCCRNCGKPLTQTPGRKPVKFCCDACRTHWWNTHLDKVNRKASEQMLRLLPNARKREIAGAAHEVNLQAPQQLAKELSAFWESLPKSSDL